MSQFWGQGPREIAPVWATVSFLAIASPYHQRRLSLPTSEKSLCPGSYKTSPETGWDRQRQGVAAVQLAEADWVLE